MTCLLPRFHAERAIDIITHILPEDHLLLASSKRVKGKGWFMSLLGCCPFCEGHVTKCQQNIQSTTEE